MVKKKDLFTLLPGGGFLILPIDVLDKMEKHAQRSGSDCEAGGLIIGSLRQKKEERFLLNSPPHIEITDISEPGLKDLRTRFSFVRKGKHHRELVNKAKINSNNEIDYLGEWHTHPEANPLPSSIDVYHWERNLRGRHAALIIIGTKSVWVGYWNGWKVINLPTLEVDCFALNSD
ncbi:Mov34/MPN/PAD-1 family protein [Pseudoalteromonas sp. MER144-MNA-CIBAN-0113]|uniref:Mov34/MPN/PAD-1 family protein n=1 Tax=Pseudoalteromonas sp. MER144-MNA-CIBAN-0113 TaxID=3140429 RepID=UPI003317973D